MIEIDFHSLSGSNISCMQMAVINGCPHTIAILLQNGAQMTPFLSGDSILDVLIANENIPALDFLFHQEKLNLRLGEKVASHLNCPF